MTTPAISTYAVALRYDVNSGTESAAKKEALTIGSGCLIVQQLRDSCGRLWPFTVQHDCYLGGAWCKHLRHLIPARPKSMNGVVAKMFKIECTLCGIFQDLQCNRFGIHRVGWLHAKFSTCGFVRTAEDSDLFGRICARRRKFADVHCSEPSPSLPSRRRPATAPIRSPRMNRTCTRDDVAPFFDETGPAKFHPAATVRRGFFSARSEFGLCQVRWRWRPRAWNRQFR
jgi:hypothetical protein